MAHRTSVKACPDHLLGPLVVEVDSRIDALARLDQGLRDWGADLIPAGTLRTVILVLDELFTNVVTHGYLNDPGGRVRIEASVRDEAVQVSITDQAPAFDPRQVPFPDTTLGIEQRPIGGLGLLFVRRMADSLDYQRLDDGRGPARNVVTFTKRLA